MLTNSGNELTTFMIFNIKQRSLHYTLFALLLVLNKLNEIYKQTINKVQPNAKPLNKTQKRKEKKNYPVTLIVRALDSTQA